MKSFIQNTLTTKGFSFTGKNSSNKSIDYRYKTIILPKNVYQYQRNTYFPIKRNYSDLSLTNRQINEEVLLLKSQLNKFTSNKIEPKLIIKLDPIIRNKLFEDDGKNLELKKNNSYVNTYFKNKMNVSVQSDLFYEEEMKKQLNSHQNSIINYLLNQKIKICRRPKLKKINISKTNLIDNIKHIYGKALFPEKFDKKFLQNSKLVNHYLQEKNKNSNSADKSNISLIIKKDNNFLDNKNFYEIVQFGNKKEKVATKLIFDDNDYKNEDKLDCHFLMKFPENSKNNNSIYSSNYSNVFSNFSSWKSKIKSKNLKNKENKENNIINYWDLKLLSQKGFENMKKKRYRNFSRIIGETIEDVKTNRKKYDSLLEINLKIYNKNKNEVLNNDL